MQDNSTHATAGGSQKAHMRVSKQNKRGTSSKGLRVLLQEKKILKRSSSIPASLLPDVAYQQGYLTGYQQQSSMWGFFTQFYDILLRLDGSGLTRCVFEVGISTSLAILVCILSDGDLEWTPKRDDGEPLLTYRSDPIGHTILGSLLAFLTVFRSQIAWSMCTPAEVEPRRRTVERGLD